MYGGQEEGAGRQAKEKKNFFGFVLVLRRNDIAYNVMQRNSFISNVKAGCTAEVKRNSRRV